LIEVLLLAGWVFEVNEGRRVEAEAKTTEALNGWIDRGLGYSQDSDGRRYFDPVEVVNFLKWSGVAGHDRFWADHFVQTGRRLVEDLRGARVGSDAAHAYGPARFRMSLRRDFELQGVPEGAKLRLRAPLPISGHGVRDLDVSPVVPAELHADVSARDERLEVKLAAPAWRPITIGAALAFTATAGAGGPDRLTPDQADLYLRKSEWPIGVTPRIEALAASLCAESQSPMDAVRAFWAYMIDELMYGMVRYSDAPQSGVGDWVLDTGWYDCQVGSALLASLCRARGIPARMVSGHFLYPLAPTHHYWVEVWIEGRGWLPFDFFSWELSEAGQDPAWRDIFAGSIDYRAVSQCFPLAFTGPMSARFPAAWQMVVSGTRSGIEIAYLDITDGSLIYCERVEVERLGPLPSEGSDKPLDNNVERDFFPAL
jgi:hypothetical protein